MKKETTIVLNEDIDSGYAAHNQLSSLAFKLNNADCDRLIIDISNVHFIASNQFAVLGCLLDNYKRQHEHVSLILRGIQSPIQEMIQKNRFGVHHFDLSPLPDIHNTVIPYKAFHVQEINEYELYLTLKLFSRNDLPVMSSSLKNLIQDYLLEVFKNVTDHTSSDYVYTCGQYFPKASLLYFTIVDSGETIPYNVTRYFQKNGQALPNNSLQWALMQGTTTSSEAGPRGIGLYLIKNFIQENQGKIIIVSGQECYEFSSYRECYQRLEYPFPGTIVTLAFNLRNTSVYASGSEKMEIIF